MNHLSKIKTWVWLTFSFILIALFGTTYFVFTRKVEKYISIQIKVSKNGIDKIMLNSKDMIHVNKESKIRVRYNLEYYNVTIEEIEDKKDGETEITIKEKIPEFSFGTTMNATIIYSSIPVWEKIIEW